MQYTSWLALVSLLATSVSGFYPWIENSNSEGDSTSAPSLPHSSLNPPVGQTHTIKIKKRRTRWNKRQNKYPASMASAPSLPNSMGINQDGQDYSYFSSVKLGSEGKEFWMLVDSGSANTWVFGSDCTTQACSKHDTFGKGDSDTLKITSNEWNVTYGTGRVNGLVASDRFAFAGYEVEVGFGLASNASDQFMTYPMDGILGLGRASSNRLGTPTLMQVMANEKLLKENMFGIHLSRSDDGVTDGQLTFGASDPSKFSGDLSFTNSVSAEGLWEIPVEGAGVDGHSLGLTGKTAVVDTGTSYILMPLDDAKAVHGKLPGSSNSGEIFTIPCDSSLPIQFTFSGITYDVSPKDYVGSPDETGKMCASNVVGHQSFGPNTWLLGDVFLKNVYTVFDFDRHRIGFGIKSNAASPTASSSSSTSPTSPPGTTSEAVLPHTIFPSSSTQDLLATIRPASVNRDLRSKAGSPTTTSIGQVKEASPSPAAEATAMSSMEGEKTSAEGMASAPATSPLFALLAISLTTLLAVSGL